MEMANNLPENPNITQAEINDRLTGLKPHFLNNIANRIKTGQHKENTKTRRQNRAKISKQLTTLKSNTYKIKDPRNTQQKINKLRRLEELSYRIGKNKPTIDIYAPAFTPTATSPNIELLPNVVNYITELPTHMEDIQHERTDVRERSYNLGRRIDTLSLKNPTNTRENVLPQLQVLMSAINNWTLEEKTRALQYTNTVINDNMAEVPKLAEKSKQIKKDYDAMLQQISTAEDSGMNDDVIGPLIKKKDALQVKLREANSLVASKVHAARWGVFYRKLIESTGTSESLFDNALREWNIQYAMIQGEIKADKNKISMGMKRPPDWKGYDLYDPRTGTKIDLANTRANYLRFNKLIAEFNLSQEVVEKAPIGNIYNVDVSTTTYEFILRLFLNPKITIGQMVSFYFIKGRATPGCDSFEVLCRLYIFFGGIPNVRVDAKHNPNYNFMKRIDIKKNTTYEIYDTNEKAFDNVRCIGTGKEGVSDITLINTNDKTVPENPIKIYLSSVKWFAEEQSPSDYDIANIGLQKDTFLQTEYAKQKGINSDNIKIIVFLKRRGEFIKKCKAAVSGRHPENNCLQFYGWEEDVSPFLETIRRNIFQYADRKEKTPQQLFNEVYRV